MEATKEEIKEVIKEKKPRISKVKKDKVDKLVIVESSTTDLETQNKELIKEEVIISFDPGFKKLGVAIINTKSGDYVDSYTIEVRPEGKLT
jgi:hypothetical protein